jgi:hypothetical protein
MGITGVAPARRVSVQYGVPDKPDLSRQAARGIDTPYTLSLDEASERYARASPLSGDRVAERSGRAARSSAIPSRWVLGSAADLLSRFSPERERSVELRFLAALEALTLPARFFALAHHLVELLAASRRAAA